MRLLIASLLFLLSVLKFQIAFSQDWRYAIRGGSVSSATSSNYRDEVREMATDAHGNLYVLSQTNRYGTTVTGSSISLDGAGSGEVLLSSFKCDGSLRWMKLISGRQNDLGVGLAIDSLDGVYVALRLFISQSNPSNQVSIGGDTIIGKTGYTNYKQIHLVKYDTSGNFKWYRAPQSDTVSLNSVSYNAPVGLDVNAQGDVYCLSQVAPGAYGNGSYVVGTQYGPMSNFIIMYDRNGVFKGMTPIDAYLEIAQKNYRFKKNWKTGNFYLYGSNFLMQGTVKIAGVTIDNPMFVAKFKADGTNIWYKKGYNSIGTIGYGAFDDSGNIYLSGAGYSLSYTKY